MFGSAHASREGGNMATHMTLSQISNGNPAYDSYYRQVDPANTGKVGAGEAAQFLKKSGLSDSTLGKIWELSDSDHKGYLDKRGFFVALRLVASAQSGNDVSHNSLNHTVPAPKFRDTGSPSLISASLLSTDSSWAVRSDERAKFDGIFESLGPVGGLLSGDKVKPVLINSKLPLDVLGRIWDLSDVDKDGHLDKEEFTVAMHLVHRAMEKEPVPATLPLTLIPPSKRKKIAGSLPGSVAVLPASPFKGLGLRPTTDPQGRQSPLGSSSISSSSSALGGTGSLAQKYSFKSSQPPQPAVSWVVPLADRGRYDDIFAKADSDMDGLVGGAEVKDIFMNSGLPQNMLARIWSLADTKQQGKLSREQFSLAMYLIQQKVTKGLDPPQVLTLDMIPPSEKGTSGLGFYGFTAPLLTPQRAVLNSRRDTVSSSSVVPLELTGTKELDDIIQEINQLQREKVTLEQEIREMEQTLRHKNSELQDMQGELEQESSGVQDLEAQRHVAQDRLQEMDQQRAKLEDKINDAKSKYQNESQKVVSLQLEISSQEQEVQGQEKELSRTRTDLYCLEQEEEQLEESIRAGQAKLQSILNLLKSSQDEMEEATSELAQIQSSQQELTKTIEEYSKALNGSLSDLSRFPELNDPLPNNRPLDRLNEGKESSSSSLRSRIAMFNHTAKETPADPFKSEDPFKSDPFQDPFGGDPFKESDPFKSADPFASGDPFGKSSTKTNLSRGGSPFAQSIAKPKDSDPFGTEDPFADSAFGAQRGFADFGQMSKNFSGSAFERRPSHPPKKTPPPKPAPPPYSSSQGAPGHSLGPASHVVSRGQRGPPASLANIAAVQEVASLEVRRSSWSGPSGRASGWSRRG
ncbi:epidermal growth factor receptor substrate 15-like 1 isoform X4 [Alosa alosa]|uniref:epidermal growth factor receptor substrate 15-like 1 isoform X4 n=1 Tax=Alosa alosa TaxID=278164 RepID=UPI00201515F6|nr:epidermal growth factor receptor substrate 15-like 1 isoform X4 [Alosa alosa]